MVQRAGQPATLGIQDGASARGHVASESRDGPALTHDFLGCLGGALHFSQQQRPPPRSTPHSLHMSHKSPVIGRLPSERARCSAREPQERGIVDRRSRGPCGEPRLQGHEGGGVRRSPIHGASRGLGGSMAGVPSPHRLPHVAPEPVPPHRLVELGHGDHDPRDPPRIPQLSHARARSSERAAQHARNMLHLPRDNASPIREQVALAPQQRRYDLRRIGELPIEQESNRHLTDHSVSHRYLASAKIFDVTTRSSRSEQQSHQPPVLRRSCRNKHCTA